MGSFSRIDMYEDCFSTSKTAGVILLLSDGRIKAHSEGEIVEDYALSHRIEPFFRSLSNLLSNG